MKLRQILEDTGAEGKSFEKKFIQALQMVGLEFEINRASGALWDIRPKGQGWSRLLNNQNINIKVARTRWMFGSSELSKLLPWNDVDSGMDLQNAEEIVKKLLDKKGVSQNVFLKPKDETIQQHDHPSRRCSECRCLEQIDDKIKFLRRETWK